MTLIYHRSAKKIASKLGFTLRIAALSLPFVLAFLEQAIFSAAHTASQAALFLTLRIWVWSLLACLVLLISSTGPRLVLCFLVSSVTFIGYYSRAELGSYPGIWLYQFALSNFSVITSVLSQERVSIAGLAALIFIGAISLSLTAKLPDRRTVLGLFSIQSVLAAGCLSLLLINSEKLSARGYYSELRALTTKGNPLVALLISTFEKQGSANSLDLSSLERISLKSVETRKESKPQPADKDQVVLLFIIESLRGDLFNDPEIRSKVLPFTDSLLRRGSILFTDVHSQSTQSSYSDISLLTSLSPWRAGRCYSYTDSERWPRTTIHKAFQNAGYFTALISSQNESWGGMIHILKNQGIDLIFDAESAQAELPRYFDSGLSEARARGILVNGKLFDDITAKKVVSVLEESENHRRPLFISINFQAPHFPYIIPNGNSDLLENLPDNFMFSDYQMQYLAKSWSRYLAALSFVDQQIKLVVDAANNLRGGSKLVTAIIGDNGESFYDKDNLVTHGKSPHESQIKVPLVLISDEFQKNSISKYPATLLDLSPTLASFLKIPTDKNWHGINLIAKKRPAVRKRLRFSMLSGSEDVDRITLGQQVAVLIYRDQKRYELFNLKKDPKELVDVSVKNRRCLKYLSNVLNYYVGQTKSYYNNPALQKIYYPPKPPLAIKIRSCQKIRG